MRLYDEFPLVTRQQELLLQASILEGDDALSAWHKWKGMTDLEDHLDYGSFRLLPLLYKNLLSHEVKDPFMNILKGNYRMAWYENQSLFYRISNIIHYLQDAGINTMILKGAALTILHYKDYGVRPMADIDVLVPTSQASLAVELLENAGWTAQSNFKEGDLRYRHSWAFYNQSKKILDLHWHVLYESCQDNSDADFWDGAVPLKINGVSAYALNPTDMLLHVIIHGVRWELEPPIRWIADAMSVINSSGSEIDWMRLVSQVKRHRLALRFKKGINFLNEKFQARVPDTIMDKINDIPISPVERLEYRYIMSSQEQSLLAGFPIFLVEYMRLMNGIGLLPALAEFPNFLRYRSGRNLHQLLLRLVSRTKRKVLGQSQLLVRQDDL